MSARRLTFAEVAQIACAAHATVDALFTPPVPATETSTGVWVNAVLERMQKQLDARLGPAARQTAPSQALKLLAPLKPHLSDGTALWVSQAVALCIDERRLAECHDPAAEIKGAVGFLTAFKTITEKTK